MSLINDALKKAQRQRTGESDPGDSAAAGGGERAAGPGQRRTRAASNVPVMQLALGAGAVLIFVVGCVFLVQYLINRPVSPPPAKPPAVAEAAPKPVELAPKPAETTPAKPAPAVATTFVLPVAAPLNTPPATTKPAPAALSKPAAVVAAVVLPPPEPAPAPVKPAGPPKMDLKAINYIEALHVAGIRASATDSKVLMNDRVYRVGNIVEHELGLKLTEITSSSLSFEDEHGASYTRNF